MFTYCNDNSEEQEYNREHHPVAVNVDLKITRIVFI